MTRLRRIGLGNFLERGSAVQRSDPILRPERSPKLPQAAYLARHGQFLLPWGGTEAAAAELERLWNRRFEEVK